MSKVMTFSRAFPSYHPRKGEPTYFVEKILKGLSIPNYWRRFDESNITANTVDFIRNFNHKESGIKGHTIRAGHRFKVGDKFSPRVWSGKPYASKQIIIAPDIEVKKVWDYEIKNEFQGDGFYNFFYLNGIFQTWKEIEGISKNDGLELEDFVHWFKANDGYFLGKEYKCSFDGQIICWDENINY
jgi:hypothetical protein